MKKLSQRQVVSNHHVIDISLVGDCGSISITDNGLYPDDDSRSYRRDMGFNIIIVPTMSRETLKDLKIAIGEVLKNSK